jgi:hypothetical protein
MLGEMPASEIVTCYHDPRSNMAALLEKRKNRLLFELDMEKAGPVRRFFFYIFNFIFAGWKLIRDIFIPHASTMQELKDSNDPRALALTTIDDVLHGTAEAEPTDEIEPNSQSLDSNPDLEVRPLTPSSKSASPIPSEVASSTGSDAGSDEEESTFKHHATNNSVVINDDAGAGTFQRNTTNNSVIVNDDAGNLTNNSVIITDDAGTGNTTNKSVAAGKPKAKKKPPAFIQGEIMASVGGISMFRTVPLGDKGSLTPKEETPTTDNTPKL